jgi:hypothetical protein
MAQLELWGEMGCCVDEDHPAYKQFMLDQVRQGKTHKKAKKQVMIREGGSPSAQDTTMDLGLKLCTCYDSTKLENISKKK